MYHAVPENQQQERASQEENSGIDILHATIQKLQRQLEEQQQALTLLQTRYDDLYDASPIGYLTLAGYDTIVEGNVTGAEMLGVRKEHLGNHTFTDFLVREDQDIFHLHRRQLFKTRQKQSCEIRLKRLDGTLRYAQLESVPLLYADGEIVQFRMAIIDISKHKLELKSLWESEFRYGSMFDDASDMIMIYDLNGQLQEVNKMTCACLGYTREDLWQMTIMDIDVQEHLARFTQHIEELRRQDNLLADTVFLCQDGTRIAVEASRRLISYAGNPAILCIARDMTTRKQVEEALRESERRYKRITDAVTDYIYTVRLQDGQPAETIHRPSSVAVTGYTPEEFAADPFLWINMVHEQDREAVKKQAQDILAGKDVKPLEHRITRKDGTLRWVKNTCVLHTDNKGQLLSYDGLIQDITERKQAEEALRASEEWFRTIANFTYDWETWIGPGRNYLYVSLSCKRITGYPPEAFYHDPDILLKIVHPDDYARVQTHFHEEFTNEDVHFLDFRILTAAGEERWIGHICQAVYSDKSEWLGRRSSNRDITDRKQAEEALQESESRYRAMMQAFDGLIYICSQDYRIEFMNEHLMKRTGYDATGELCYAALHGLEDICPWCVNDEVFQGHTTRWEVQSPKDQRWYYVVNTPFYHADGRISKQAMIMDITDRKAAEEALRESEERYRRIVELSPDAILVHQDNRYVYVNAAGVQLLGAESLDHLIGKSIFDIIHPDYHEIASKRIQEAYLDWKTSALMEEKYVRLDGTEMDVEVAGGPIIYQGRPAIQIVLRDITERKRAEEALRTSEAHYRMLFEDSPISLWEEDFSAVKSYIDQLRTHGVADFRAYFEQHPEIMPTCAGMVKVLHINKATLQLYKAKNKEEFYQGLNKIFTRESYHLFQEELIAIAEGRTLLQSETVNLTLTGEKIYSELRWVVVPECEDTLSKVLVSIVNITERKLAEEQLKHTMVDLARSNTDLEQFAYAASHDLQQPLLMVDCYGQLLMKRYKDKLGTDADEFLDGIVYGVERMQMLIKDLLEYSRLHKPDKNVCSIDCHDILAEVLQNLQVLIEEHKAVITHTTLPNVKANSSQFVRLFQNLIGNAIKFRGEEPPRIHISADLQEEYWMFAVEDNGIGIAPDDASRIFVIFERLHSHEQYPGTGIGLAMCKKIVEQHGGRIWVESEPGQGSTFYFTIPVE